MNKINLLFLLIIFSSISPIIAIAQEEMPINQRPPAVLYVSPSGVDYSECTQSYPCRDIQKAVDVALPGDIISIAEGDYQPFTIKDKHGTKKAPIYFVGNGKVRIGPTKKSDRDNIFVTYCDWIVFSNIGSFGANRAGIRIDNSHNIVVRNSRFGNNRVWGIFLNHSNDALIENNETYGSLEQHGIYYSNSADRPTIRNNRSYNNAGCGIHINGDQSMGEGRDVMGDGIISGAIIENNIIYNNGRKGGAGLNLDGLENAIVRNNLLYDNHASGIALFKGDGAKGANNVKVYNNTVDMAEGGRWAVVVKNAAGKVYIFNNILINRNAGRGAFDLGNFSNMPLLLARFKFMGTNVDMQNVVSDYNIFAGGKGIVTLTDNESRFELDVWKNTGNDKHSVFVKDKESLFKSIINADYHPAEKSAAVDTGITLAEVKTDLENTPRPKGKAFDVGAYEK